MKKKNKDSSEDKTDISTNVNGDVDEDIIKAPGEATGKIADCENDEEAKNEEENDNGKSAEGEAKNTNTPNGTPKNEIAVKPEDTEIPKQSDWEYLCGRNHEIVSTQILWLPNPIPISIPIASATAPTVGENINININPAYHRKVDQWLVAPWRPAIQTYSWDLDLFSDENMAKVAPIIEEAWKNGASSGNTFEIPHKRLFQTDSQDGAELISFSFEIESLEEQKDHELKINNLRIYLDREEEIFVEKSKEGESVAQENETMVEDIIDREGAEIGAPLSPEIEKSQNRTMIIKDLTKKCQQKLATNYKLFEEALREVAWERIKQLVFPSALQLQPKHGKLPIKSRLSCEFIEEVLKKGVFGMKRVNFNNSGLMNGCYDAVFFAEGARQDITATSSSGASAMSHTTQQKNSIFPRRATVLLKKEYDPKGNMTGLRSLMYNNETACFAHPNHPGEIFIWNFLKPRIDPYMWERRLFPDFFLEKIVTRFLADERVLKSQTSGTSGTPPWYIPDSIYNNH